MGILLMIVKTPSKIMKKKMLVNISQRRRVKFAENGHKIKEESKDDKKKDKKKKGCDCEKERKKLKGKKDKHYDEEEWEEHEKICRKI